MHDRTDGVYLLPASTQFETYGSVTASNRSLQWREKVIEPLFESLPDHVIMQSSRRSSALPSFFRNIEVKNGALTVKEPLIEDITREFNRGMWTIGYTGQSPGAPEAAHGQPAHLRQNDAAGPWRSGDGDYYGLPWPCWGTPEMKHPGTPNLYDTSKPVAEGGLTFRARFGVERGRRNLLAEAPTLSVRKFRTAIRSSPWHAAQAWLGRRPDGRRTGCHQEGGRHEDDKKLDNWKTDLSGGIQRVAIKHGCAPFGNAKARTVVWTFPDPVPLHREPLYTNAPRPGGQVPDLRGPVHLPAADPLCVDPEDRLLQGLPDHPDLRPSGGVRGRRRRDPLQPVACRAAAGHVRRNQPA
jgi:formate dehydrogenase major subunit